MYQDSFRYGDRVVSYKVVHSASRNGKVAIHVNHDGSVQVDAPENAEKPKVKEAVKKRSRWIVTHLQQAEKLHNQILKREYVSGETHFYLGKQYLLKVLPRKRIPESVKLLRGRIEVVTHSTEPEYVKGLLNIWYRQKAEALFKKRLDAVVADISWLSNVPEWKMRVMKKHWGSCSANGVISLNPYLVKAPRECVDYVITHELCHIKEHNHSKAYYRLLNKTLPGWEVTKARLDGMAELLLNE